MGQFPLPSPAFQPRPFLKDIKDVKDLLYLTQEEFSAAFKGSSVKRAKRRGLLRNAIAALPGLCTEEMSTSTFPKRLYRLQRLQRPASSEHALDDPEELVREAAAWSLHGRDEQVDLP